MFEQFQNETAGNGLPTGPVCWYPGPETWNFGEQDGLLDAASLGHTDDLLFA